MYVVIVVNSSNEIWIRYDVPETIAAAIVGGNAEYLKWVADSVK